MHGSLSSLAYIPYMINHTPLVAGNLRHSIKALVAKQWPTSAVAIWCTVAEKGHSILTITGINEMSGVSSNTIYDARLTNGYYGTVEVLTYRGWQPLCRYYYYWSSSQSRVLCHQYGLEDSSSSKDILL